MRDIGEQIASVPIDGLEALKPSVGPSNEEEGGKSRHYRAEKGRDYHLEEESRRELTNLSPVRRGRREKDSLRLVHSFRHHGCSLV
ncbi:MAG: hypothetical protein HYZ58_17255 [Acidobacteria bacterium]|nr:hypothetical protein [Acidobacteriota bacterium]